MTHSLHSLTDLAADAARAAGAILREGFGKPLDIQYKGEINLVTEYDHAAEAVILERLRAATPTFDILTEESGAHGQGAEFRWVIDPLDGTTNYAHHFPYFSVSIALERAGETVLGVVYEPLLDQLFTARQGDGAYLNSAAIRVSEASELRHAVVATGLIYEMWESDRGLEEINRLIKRARSVRLNGSAALDLSYVACGRLDAYCDTGLSPWDIAAGGLIVSEAGGKFHLYGDSSDNYHRYVIGSNGAIHHELARELGFLPV